MQSEALVVEDLRVEAVAAQVDIVDDVSFAVQEGTALGLVGESGCGKTTVAMALLGWARPGTQIAGGSIRIGGVDTAGVDSAAIRRLRGRRISYVPQNPSRALSPGMRVGEQVQEMLDAHVADRGLHRELYERAWAGAQLPDDPSFARRYPHQLSGGQQQRVAIAMALVCAPAVVVMDEPTTGLDVLTQERLLEVIGDLRTTSDSAFVYISHDLGVVRNLVDDVAVMYAGRIVEHGRADDVFTAPQHPYTRRLLEAIPRVHEAGGEVRGIPGHAVEPWDRPRGCPFQPRCEYRVPKCTEMPPPIGPTSARCWRVGELRPFVPATRVASSVVETNDNALLVVDQLHATYRSRRVLKGADGERPAVDGVSFAVPHGACVAVVGESGSGKTTTARCIAGLHESFTGLVTFDGHALATRAAARSLDLRRRIQIVFQDPDSSLNPSMSVGASIRRPLEQFFGVRGREADTRVAELLEQVHLPRAMTSRLPRELSGGEKQRVAIARAIAARPQLLICDEITSALDVAVQASIIELLEELRRASDMAMLFVSHDLAVVRTISDIVLVMSEGKIVEQATTADLFTAPADEYTRRLLAAAPDLRPGDYPPSLELAAEGTR